MGQRLSAITVDHGCFKAYKFEYEWILNFENLATQSKVGYSTASEYLYPTAQEKQSSFHLILYFNGYNDRVKDYLSVYLHKNSNDEMLIQFTCAILDNDKQEIVTKSIKKMIGIESYLGWITYCRRDFLLDNKAKILINRNLTLKCTLEIFENKAMMNAETEDDLFMNKSRSRMSKDMKQLLLDGDFSDITIKVEDKDFPVHKAILISRSARFKRMLISKRQANPKEIIISDINSESMKEMLNYIYTSDVGHMDVQMAQKLYNAASKYELHDLEYTCNVILARNLDVNNAIGILLFGHKCSDNDLIYTSIEFIAKNAPKFQKKKEWMSLMKNYPELANMVFKYLSQKS